MKSLKKTFKPKPLPPFRTLDEEVEFWDTHDTAVLFKNPKTPVSALEPLENEKQEVMTVRLQKSVEIAYSC
jgi:hypothetical protein